VILNSALFAGIHKFLLQCAFCESEYRKKRIVRQDYANPVPSVVIPVYHKDYRNSETGNSPDNCTDTRHTAGLGLNNIFSFIPIYRAIMQLQSLNFPFFKDNASYVASVVLLCV